jgi:valyl-tRNA synthetase
MSKSVGNVVTPLEPIERFGADAVRYWAAGSRLGVDTAYDEGQLRVGRRLATKLLNVARFVLGLPHGDGAVTEAVDRALLGRLAGVVGEATGAYDRFDHAAALGTVETFFWEFCDDHVELVKSRAYGDVGPDGAASAVAGLRSALDVLLRLLAPTLPFVTEEVWSWWREGSVHRAAWPDARALRASADGADAGLPELVSWVLGEVRRAKSEARVSMRARVERLCVQVDAPTAAALRHAAVDLALAAGATHVEIRTDDGAPRQVEVSLAS